MNKVIKKMPKNTTANTILNTRATSRFWGFKTMIETALDGNPKFSLSSVIDEYWETTDSEDFTTYEKIMRLQYQLLFKGFASYDIKMRKKFLYNYKHFIFGMYDQPDETEKYYDSWLDIKKMKISLDNGL